MRYLLISTVCVALLPCWAVAQTVPVEASDDSGSLPAEASEHNVSASTSDSPAGEAAKQASQKTSTRRKRTKNIAADEGPRGASYHRSSGWSIGAPTITYSWRLKKMNVAVGSRWLFMASAFFDAPSGNAFVWVGQQRKDSYQMKCYAGVTYLDLGDTSFNGQLTAVPAGCYLRFGTRRPKFWITGAAEGVIAIGNTEVAVNQQVLNGSVASSFLRFGAGVTLRLGKKWLLDSRLWILPSEFIQTAATTTVEIDERTTAEVVVLAPEFEPFPFGAEIEVSLRYQPSDRFEMSLGLRAGNLALQSVGIAVPGINALPLASLTWRPRSRRRVP